MALSGTGQHRYNPSLNDEPNCETNNCPTDALHGLKLPFHQIYLIFLPLKDFPQNGQLNLAGRWLRAILPCATAPTGIETVILTRFSTFMACPHRCPSSMGLVANEKGQAPRTKKGNRAELARRLRRQPE
jgi:hypothetical protein